MLNTPPGPQKSGIFPAGKPKRTYKVSGESFLTTAEPPNPSRKRAYAHRSKKACHLSKVGANDIGQATRRR